ncbi:acyltransferase [Roseomonas sp. CCTCC AB2023176]|uniref:acyltransferase n=1 Tax=Roseomonas sp. CCTCC AB2023176 TaxID=3342640 RepID=UPI0035E1839B
MSSAAAPGAGLRPEWDLIKCYGVVLVLAIHVSASGLYAWGQVPRGDWWAAVTINGSSRTAVPLFLMASGAALLDTRKTVDIARFLSRRVRRVVVPLLFWSLLYLAFSAWRIGQPDSLAEALRRLLAGSSFYHLPFLYWLLGAYLCAPVLAPFAERAGRGATGYFLALWFGVCVAAIVASRTGYVIGVQVPVAVGFLGYFVAGRLLRDVAIEGRAIPACLAVAAAGLLATLLPTFQLTKKAGALVEIFLDPVAPNVVAMTLATFLLLTSGPVRRGLARSPRLVAVLGFGATISFGIYLIHPLLLTIMLQGNGLAWNSFGPWIGIPLGVAALLVLSGGTTWLMQRVPGLRQVAG